jgi:hypothetical protein
MTYWSILCGAGHRRGPASESICVMCRKRCGRRRTLPILMMIRRGNGATSDGRTSERNDSCSRRISDHGRKLLRALAAELPRAGHTCSRSVFCLVAIGGSAPYDGSGFLACARKRLPQPVRAAGVPRIGPCPGSSGSGPPACAGRNHRSGFLRWPSPSRGERRERFCGRD